MGDRWQMNSRPHLVSEKHIGVKFGGLKILGPFFQRAQLEQMGERAREA